MTDDNSNTELVDIPEDLASFKAVFLGKEEPAKVEDTEDDALANDTDTDASAETEDEDLPEEESDDTDEPDDTEADDESADEDAEEAEPEDKGKGKKSNYQTRINELTRARREAERNNSLLLQRLEALEAEARKNIPEQKTVTEQLPQGSPKPDDTDAEGAPKYPLGEFDPAFILDISKFTVEQAFNEQRKKEASEHAAQQVAKEQEALKSEWASRLDEAEAEVPEIREHIAELVTELESTITDPAYGEYLATTIMQCENGPAIMEYLSQNIGEAQKIVASGPAAATRSIGRLDAILEKDVVRPIKEEKRNKKPSGAVAPPVVNTRGNRGSTSVRADTNDLAAFKREFYRAK